MTVRVFGGWEFKPGDDQRSDYVDLGDDQGVPMGGKMHSAEQGKEPKLYLKFRRHSPFNSTLFSPNLP